MDNTERPHKAIATHLFVMAALPLESDASAAASLLDRLLRGRSVMPRTSSSTILGRLAKRLWFVGQPAHATSITTAAATRTCTRQLCAAPKTQPQTHASCVLHRRGNRRADVASLQLAISSRTVANTDA